MKIDDRLARDARRLRRATLLGLIAVLGLLVAGTLQGLLQGSEPAMLRISSRPDPAARDWLGILVALGTSLPFAMALWQLNLMLACIERGQIFVQPTIAHLRRFALYVLIAAITSILLPPAATVLAGLADGAALSRVTITFDGGDFFILLASGLLFFVVKLLGEAQRLAEDNRMIV